MPDQSDVEAAFVKEITAVIYPNGIDAPSAIHRIARVYRGWPNAAALDADLAAGIVNVTVFPSPSSLSNTTRWISETSTTATRVPTLLVNVERTSVTFSGDAAPGQIAGILVDDLAVVYRTRTGDTPDSVAANLTGYLGHGRPALAAGPRVEVPGSHLVIGRVVADQVMTTLTRRQRQEFRLSFWCPDPSSRDNTVSYVDQALSRVTFLDLGGGWVGHTRLVSSAAFDQSQDAALYRRDLVYSVEYDTTNSESVASMIFGDVLFSGSDGSNVRHLLG